jgi:four helix bundle protein
MRLGNANTAAAETQTWIEFAVRCGYLEMETGRELHQTYDRILALLVKMSVNVENWTISR